MQWEKALEKRGGAPTIETRTMRAISARSPPPPETSRTLRRRFEGVSQPREGIRGDFSRMPPRCPCARRLGRPPRCPRARRLGCSGSANERETSTSTRERKRGKGATVSARDGAGDSRRGEPRGSRERGGKEETSNPGSRRGPGPRSVWGLSLFFSLSLSLFLMPLAGFLRGRQPKSPSAVRSSCRAQRRADRGTGRSRSGRRRRARTSRSPRSGARASRA